MDLPLEEPPAPARLKAHGRRSVGFPHLYHFGHERPDLPAPAPAHLAAAHRPAGADAERPAGRRHRRGVPVVQRRPAARGVPALRPQDARRRRHRRPVAERGPDAGRAGHVVPGAAHRGRLHRLDRQHRRQPLPRHPLRPGHGHAPVAAGPRRSAPCASTRSSASTTSSSTTRTCSAPTGSTAPSAAARRSRRRWARPSFTTWSASTWRPARTRPAARARSLLAAAYRAACRSSRRRRATARIGMNLAALQLEGSQAAHRPAARREPDGRHRLGRQEDRARSGVFILGGGSPKNFMPADRAADSGSARPGGERARLLPASHRRPPRHRRPVRGHAAGGDDLGQGRSRASCPTR